MGACLQPPCFKKYFHKMDNKSNEIEEELSYSDNQLKSNITIIDNYMNLSNTDESNTNESNTNKSNTNESNPDESNTDESNTNESNTNESNTNESNPDESNTNESNTENKLDKLIEFLENNVDIIDEKKKKNEIIKFNTFIITCPNTKGKIWRQHTI